jgi:hypothetical protein
MAFPLVFVLFVVSASRGTPLAGSVFPNHWMENHEMKEFTHKHDELIGLRFLFF